MPPRYFTVDQANRLLPEITPLLEALRESQRTLAAYQTTQEELKVKARSNGHNHSEEIAEMARSIQIATKQASDLVSQITAMGIQVKDIEMGLVDFPTIHDGRRVLLCWKLGETAVDYWHEVNTGYGSRQPIQDRDEGRDS